jgi:hypothetical protein
VGQRLVQVHGALECADRLVQLTEMVIRLAEVEVRFRALWVVLDDEQAALERLLGRADPQIALDGVGLERETTVLAVVVVCRVLDLALGALRRSLRSPSLSRHPTARCKHSGQGRSSIHGQRLDVKLSPAGAEIRWRAAIAQGMWRSGGDKQFSY